MGRFFGTRSVDGARNCDGGCQNNTPWGASREIEGVDEGAL